MIIDQGRKRFSISHVMLRLVNDSFAEKRMNRRLKTLETFHDGGWLCRTKLAFDILPKKQTDH